MNETKTKEQRKQKKNGKKKIENVRGQSKIQSAFPFVCWMFGCPCFLLPLTHYIFVSLFIRFLLPILVSSSLIPTPIGISMRLMASVVMKLHSWNSKHLTSHQTTCSLVSTVTHFSFRREYSKYLVLLLLLCVFFLRLYFRFMSTILSILWSRIALVFPLAPTLMSHDIVSIFLYLLSIRWKFDNEN